MVTGRSRYNKDIQHKGPQWLKAVKWASLGRTVASVTHTSTLAEDCEVLFVLLEGVIYLKTCNVRPEMPNAESDATALANSCRFLNRV